MARTATIAPIEKGKRAGGWQHLQPTIFDADCKNGLACVLQPLRAIIPGTIERKHSSGTGDGGDGIWLWQRMDLAAHQSIPMIDVAAAVSSRQYRGSCER